jgi:lysozyme
MTVTTAPLRTRDHVLAHPGMAHLSHSEDSPEALPEPDFIDVSRHQGTVDWDAYKASGRDMAVCKLSEGGDWLDPKANENRQAMSRLGMKCGLYHFAGASGSGHLNPVEKEVENFLSKVGTMAPGEFPVLDFELTYGKTGPQMTEWISKWCSSVEQATGKTPWLYTNRRIMNRVDPTNLTKYPLWLANYNSSDKENPPDSKPWPNMIAWQYTDKAKSPGVKDPCDGNFLYGQVSA